MSINMDGASGLEYADHEVQGLGVNAATVSGDAINDALLQIEPVSQRGIDSDEVAELVAMYRVGNLAPQGSAPNNGEFVNGEMSFGINLTGETENLSAASSQATIALEDFGGGDEFRVGEVDDPGVLDSFNLGGVQAQDVSAVTERFIDFRAAFGSGPYVDRTDDLSIYGEIDPGGSDRYRVEANYILYWDVHEMPEGRASFARP